MRKFIDTGLPAGAAATAEGGVTYQVTAIRSTRAGEPGGFVVKFGVGGAGSGGVSIEESAPRVRATFTGHIGDPGIPTSAYNLYYEGENFERLTSSEEH